MPNVIKIVDIQPLRLFGIRHVGPYAEIGPVFEVLHRWQTTHLPAASQARVFGLYHDNPEVTPAAACRADAAFSVDDLAQPSDPVHAIDLPAGRYAVYRHQGAYAELPGAYAYLFYTWLPTSGHTLAPHTLCFEEYINMPGSVADADLLTDIYLPLKI